MKLNKRLFLHGQGPAPAGYFPCHDRACNQRSFSSGRFQKIPNHYHPIIPVEVCSVAGCRREFMGLSGGVTGCPVHGIRKPLVSGVPLAPFESTEGE